MSALRVALLQMASCETDREANKAKGDAFCRQAKGMGADIALFPEMWNIGYSFFDPAVPDAREAWRARAIDQADGFFLHFRELAKELEMAIAVTYLERHENRPRNSLSIIDRRGAFRPRRRHQVAGGGSPVSPRPRKSAILPHHGVGSLEWTSERGSNVDSYGGCRRCARRGCQRRRVHNRALSGHRGER